MRGSECIVLGNPNNVREVEYVCSVNIIITHPDYNYYYDRT
jgi:hypothetical protein